MCDNIIKYIIINKTKIIIFSKRKSRSNFEFKLQHETIEVADSFSFRDII